MADGSDFVSLAAFCNNPTSDLSALVIGMNNSKNSAAVNKFSQEDATNNQEDVSSASDPSVQTWLKVGCCWYGWLLVWVVVGWLMVVGRRSLVDGMVGCCLGMCP